MDVVFRIFQKTLGKIKSVGRASEEKGGGRSISFLLCLSLSFCQFWPVSRSYNSQGFLPFPISYIKV